MKQRHLFALGLLVAVGLLVSSVPALAGQRSTHRTSSPSVPAVTVTWVFGDTAPFAATRFDGALVGTKVYFLGFRTTGDATDGSIWIYDTVAHTYTDTGVDMKVPVSNYKIAALQDSHGTGLYIFGGRDANAVIVNEVQAYYPAANKAVRYTSTDPFPGTTPVGCISLPAMGVEVVTNKAYVLGGLAFAANGCAGGDSMSAQTWIFDPMAPAGTRWTQGPDLNSARGYITTAVLGGSIYAIGGDTVSGGLLTPQQIVEKWKPGQVGWNNAGVADVPVPCDETQAWGFTSGPLTKTIVVSNCGQWPNAIADTYLYNALTNSWSVVGAINDNRRNHAGWLQSGQMYILGGYGELSSFIDPIFTSEIGTGMIASRPGFSRPTHHDSGGTPSTS